MPFLRPSEKSHGSLRERSSSWTSCLRGALFFQIEANNLPPRHVIRHGDVQKHIGRHWIEQPPAGLRAKVQCPDLSAVAVERSRTAARAKETPIGWVSYYEDIDWTGLAFTRAQWDQAMAIDRATWKQQPLGHEELFLKLSEHLPKEFIARSRCRRNSRPFRRRRPAR